MNKEEIITQLQDAIVEGDEEASSRFAELALDAGADPISLIQVSIQKGLDIVGDNFQTGACYLPELILAGDAAHAALSLIIPRISENESGDLTKGTVVIGTPFGDNHDIGKNVVSAILTARGFTVIDLGINVPPVEFVQRAEELKADIIAVSTLITTCLPYQREIIKILEDKGARNKFYVILGGGPVTPDWAREIKADGYGWSANDAANLCLQLVDGESPPPLPEPIVLGALKR